MAVPPEPDFAVGKQQIATPSVIESIKVIRFIVLSVIIATIADSSRLPSVRKSVQVSPVQQFTSVIQKTLSRVVGAQGFVKRSFINILILLEKISPVDKKGFVPRFLLSAVTGVDDIPSLSPEKFLSGTLGIVSIRQMMPSTNRVESINPVDRIDFGLFQLFTESVGVFHDTNLGPIQSFVEVVGFEDVLGISPGVRQLLTESVGSISAIVPVISASRSFSEVDSVTDGLTVPVLVHQVLGEAIGVVEAVSSSAGYLASLTELFAESETVDTTGVFSRLLSETDAVADTVTTSVVRFQAFLESIGAVETVQDIGITKGIQEPISTIESTSAFPILGVGLAETVQTIEANFLNLDAARVFSQAIGTVDGLAESISGLTTRAITESIGIRDVVTRTGTLSRLFTEPIGVVDTVASLGVFQQAVTELLGVVDSVIESVTIPVSMSEVSTIVPAVSRIGTLSRVFSDPIGIRDTLFPQSGLAQAITAVIGIHEIRQSSAGKSITERSTVSGLLRKGPTLTRSVIASVLELPTTKATILNTISETVAIPVQRSFMPVLSRVGGVGTAGVMTTVIDLTQILAEVPAVAGSSVTDILGLLSQTMAVTISTTGFFNRVIDLSIRGSTLGKNFATVSNPYQQVTVTQVGKRLTTVVVVGKRVSNTVAGKLYAIIEDSGKQE